MVASFSSRNDKTVIHKGYNLTDMRRYIVQTKGKVISIGDLKKLPINKFLNTVNEKVKEIQKTSPPENNFQKSRIPKMYHLNNYRE